MKNLKIIALALLATATVSAQDLAANEIPANLKTSFQKEYSNATDVEWEMDGVNYNVEFEFNRLEHEIWYTKDGSIIRKEKECLKTDLPGSVLMAIKSKYNDYTVDEIEMIEENGVKIYEIELEKRFSKDIKIVVSENGDILTKGK